MEIAALQERCERLEVALNKIGTMLENDGGVEYYAGCQIIDQALTETKGDVSNAQ